jgi:hypothetical protein
MLAEPATERAHANDPSRRNADNPTQGNADDPSRTANRDAELGYSDAESRDPDACA